MKRRIEVPSAPGSRQRQNMADVLAFIDNECEPWVRIRAGSDDPRIVLTRKGLSQQSVDAHCPDKFHESADGGSK